MQKLTVGYLVHGALLALCVTSITNPPTAEAADLNDAQIIGIYIQVNSFDIETALLGRSQGSSSAVRQLAEHVASDHLGVRQAAYDLAASCETRPVLPKERDAAAIEHGKTMSKLLALKGSEFDRAYLQHEAAFHAAAISAVKTSLLPASACPQLQAHLREVLPAFEHHLEQTQALATQRLDHD
jgi:putative membrane protein